MRATCPAFEALRFRTGMIHILLISVTNQAAKPENVIHKLIVKKFHTFLEPRVF